MLNLESRRCANQSLPNNPIMQLVPQGRLGAETSVVHASDEGSSWQADKRGSPAQIISPDSCADWKLLSFF